MPDAFDPEAFTAQSKHNWTAVSDHYDRMSARLFPPITSAFLSFVQPRPGQIVLDVACGTGALTAAAARTVGPAGRVVGVDVSPGMLKIAMARATEGNLEYREMNAEALDLPNDVFHAVLSQLGLMLFAKPQAALAEMTRVCRKGGTVACLVQGDPDKMLFTSLLMRTMVKHAPQLKQPGAPTLYSFSPIGVLDKALTQAGLWGVVSSRVSGVFAFASPDEYWLTLVEGGGKTGAMLRSLTEPVQAAIRQDVLALAEKHRAGGRLEIPYEVVMAKGVKA